MLFSIIIPCYNEEKNIENLVQEFKKLINRHYPIELILVNNGSIDNSKSVLDKVSNENNFIRVVTVEKNQGYGFGILAGLKEATGEYLGWMHADLQTSPSEICKCISYLKNHNYPINVFQRGSRRNRPILDTLFTFGMSCFESFLFQTKLWDINAQPTMFSRSFYETWTKAPKDFSLDLYVYVIAKKQQLQIRRFPIQQHHRVAGTSSWNTGIVSRIKLAKSVMSYSVTLQQLLKNK